jgi:hypothetical protein
MGVKLHNSMIRQILHYDAEGYKKLSLLFVWI